MLVDDMSFMVTLSNSRLANSIWVCSRDFPHKSHVSLIWVFKVCWAIKVGNCIHFGRCILSPKPSAIMQVNLLHCLWYLMLITIWKYVVLTFNSKCQFLSNKTAWLKKFQIVSDSKYHRYYLQQDYTICGI